VSTNQPNDDLLSRFEKGNEILQASRAKSGIGCDKCNYRTFYLVDGKAVHCTCWNKATIERKCKEANIPNKYIGWTLEDKWYEKMDANEKDIGGADALLKMRIKRQISHYNRNLTRTANGLFLRLNGQPVQNLLLIGESSSGKTLLASIIAQEAITQGLTTVFLSWVDLEPIFADYEAREEQNAVVENCKTADVVVIDGVENLNLNHPNFFSGLERIANARMNRDGATIITAFENYVDIRGKHNWCSLISSSQKIYLPAPKEVGVIDAASPSNKVTGRYRKQSDRLVSKDQEGETK